MKYLISLMALLLSAQAAGVNSDNMNDTLNEEEASFFLFQYLAEVNCSKYDDFPISSSSALKYPHEPTPQALSIVEEGLHRMMFVAGLLPQKIFKQEFNPDSSLMGSELVMKVFCKSAIPQEPLSDEVIESLRMRYFHIEDKVSLDSSQ